MANCKICNKRLITRNACAEASDDICGNCKIISIDNKDNHTDIGAKEDIITSPIINVSDYITDVNNNYNNERNDLDKHINHSTVKCDPSLRFNRIDNTGNFNCNDTSSIEKIDDVTVEVNNKFDYKSQHNGVVYTHKTDDIEKIFHSFIEEAEARVNDSSHINIENYKDSLLASLYSQVNFLRQELEEKNLMIRTLLIKDHEVNNYYYPSPNISIHSNTDTESGSESNDSSDIYHHTFTPKNLENPISELSSHENSPPTCFKMSLEEQTVNYRQNHNYIYYQSKRGKAFMLNENLVSNNEKSIDDSNITHDNDYSNTTNDLLIDRGLGNVLKNRPEDFPLNNSHPIDDCEAYPWSPGTILITGDSMLYGIEERKLRNAKVRMHPGASIEDMYHHLGAHLRKKPSNILLLVGTNNCTSDDYEVIIEKMLALREFVQSRIPNCGVYFSTLVKRYDDNVAEKTVNLVNEKLRDTEINYMNNDNIDRSFIGKKGLHMTPRGIGKLVLNIVRWLKGL